MWRRGIQEANTPSIVTAAGHVVKQKVTVWVGKLFKINRPNIPLVADELDRDFYTGWEFRLH